MKSPLAWGRGLKLFGSGKYRDKIPVAPRVGAWIETDAVGSNKLSILSPLAWGRGLKHIDAKAGANGKASPLAWGRGLKL